MKKIISIFMSCVMFIAIFAMSFNAAAEDKISINAKSNSSSVTLSWKKKAGTNSYVVMQYNSKSDKWEKIKTTTSDKVKITGLKSATVYKFKLKNISKTVTVATCPKKMTYIGAKFMYDDDDNAIDAVAWDKMSGVSGYQIQLKTISGETKTVNIKGNKKTLYKTPAEWDYARIRAYKTADGKKYYGGYSDFREFHG